MRKILYVIKHDWDAFAGAIARRVHDHGMPVSQGELVRDMIDWFAGREDFPPPDERTVRRKVSAILRELEYAHIQLPTASSDQDVTM